MKLKMASLFLPLIVWSASGAAAWADDYPAKLIRIVAPAAAGSGTDLIARLVGREMSASMKQPVIIENRVGGGGTVGVDYVVRSAPDGYTLLLSTDATIAIQPHVMKVGYDTLKDLAPIGEISSFPLVVIASNGSGIENIGDLARVAGSKANGVSYGMGGMGTGGHIIGETIRHSLNIPMTAVAYQSAARAVTDLLGGFVNVAIPDVLSAVHHIEAGQAKAVAVAGKNRASCLPNVPTLSEQGIPFDLPYSYGLLAPANTPPEIVERLNRELNAALQSRSVREQLKLDCQSPPNMPNSPGDFAESVRYHHQRWGDLIKEAGIRIE